MSEEREGGGQRSTESGVRPELAELRERLSATTDAGPAATEHPDLPTRRLNRLQRMFGRLRRRPVQGGKSRRHAR